ncbi:MAG: hypothetical protein LBL87_06970 [Ruminococcus sp.]|jgi:hypothetical protein|nr:hypothetical protein [Ruminococcus sp.]
MKMINRILSVSLTVLLIFAMTACNSEKETAPPPYNGILTKVRLGMTESRVVSLQPESAELFYQTGNDYVMWSVNPDTEIQSLRDMLPPDDLYYYTDDSIITYYLKDNEDKTDKVLDGYMQEVYCLVPRSVAVDFYNAQVKYLAAKYGVESTGTYRGKEGIDLELNFKEVYDCPSSTVTLEATFTSDTVNNVNDYYGTHFSITLMGKETQTDVALSSGEMTVPTTAKTKATKAETETTAAAEAETSAESESDTAAETETPASE